MTLSRLIFARPEMMAGQVFGISYVRAASRFGAANFSTITRSRKRDNVKLSDQTKNKSSGRKARRLLLDDQATNANDKIGLNKGIVVNSSQVTVIGETLSENSRLLKKPKKRPVKLVNNSGGFSKGKIGSEVKTEDFELKQPGASRKSTKSHEMSRETVDTLMRLTNKHSSVEQDAPFSMPNTLHKPSIDTSSRSKGKLTFSRLRKEEDEEEKDRPFTLPSGKFKPRQSLGQNFLSDQNYVMKICDSFKDDSDKGKNVIEIGPGPGALTRVLHRRYPNMTAIEIDERAVEFLAEKIPGLYVMHMDVLKTDWPQLAADKGGCLNIIANLPYYIVSQVLFSLADSHRAVDTAVLTMQLEVAQRIVAKPSTKHYGIPSVVFQLYGSPSINFLIPPTVFYPKPKVDSALLTMDFRKPNPDLYRIDGDHLRRVLSASFQQRRKMLRQSLKDLLIKENLTLGDKWATKRPEELSPSDFVQMTAELFGENPQPEREMPAELVVIKKEAVHANTKKVRAVLPMGTLKGGRREAQVTAARVAAAAAAVVEEGERRVREAAAALAAIAAEEARVHYAATRRERSTYVTRPIWRMALFGASGTRGFGMNADEEIKEKERLERKRLKKVKRREDIAADEKFFHGIDSDEDEE